MSDAKPSRKPLSARKAAKLQAAHGDLHALIVGVNQYPPKSGFSNLKKCVNDAFQVDITLREVPQLHADPDHVKLITSETPQKPSRGTIIDQLEELSANASKEDRILFYFSGHGHRIDGHESHFLVPGDVYSDAEPDAMVSMEKVMAILEKSEAKQKIIVLDACLSGPILHGKKMRATKYSEQALMRYLVAVRGTVVITSSEGDESSYERSPDPGLSLLTYHLIRGLRGDEGALQNGILTVPSLFDYISTEIQRACRSYRLQQTPSIQDTVSGTVMIADFRQTLIVDPMVNLEAHPFQDFSFSDGESEQTLNLLPHWQDRRKTPEQLEYAANTDEAMGAYLADEFGRWRATLRKEFGFASSQLATDGGTLTFPGGRLSHRYKARSKDSGTLHRKLTLELAWFNRPKELSCLLGLFRFIEPQSIRLRTSVDLKPARLVDPLEANGWEVTSETTEKVKAHKEGVSVAITQDWVVIDGLGVKTMLDGGEESAGERETFAEILALVAPAEKSSKD